MNKDILVVVIVITVIVTLFFMTVMTAPCEEETNQLDTLQVDSVSVCKQNKGE